MSSEEHPTLHFFNTTPSQPMNEALVSSMQSFETCFLLIALRRYPHALCTCASAIEGAVKAANIHGEKDTFQSLLDEAKKASPHIQDLSDDAVTSFRRARNHFTHHGFSPRDDSESASLFLAVGLPLLEACYRDLHSFRMMEGLLQEYSRHLDIARRVHARARVVQGMSLTYCLNSFGHLIRWSLKEAFSAAWEIGDILDLHDIGRKFDGVEKVKQELVRLYAAEWSVNCPVCQDTDTAICELDCNQMESANIVPLRMACASCGFVVGAGQHFLSDELLKDQLEGARQAIIKEYGLG